LARLYKIGAVSRRTGLSPSTLRSWEEEYGLLAPARTLGGTRLYSEADVERASEIQRLVHDRGYSLGAIAEILDTSAFGSLEAREARIHSLVRRLVRAGTGQEAALSLVDGIKALTSLPTASLGVYSPRTGSLSFVVTSTDNGTERPRRPPLPISQFPISWQQALEKREPYAATDLQAVSLTGELSARVSADHTRSFHAEPLAISSRLVGVLVIGSPKTGGIAEQARELCERLAVPAGPGIQYFAAGL
jgi:DNA-binding transcriptional MerR regulator